MSHDGLSRRQLAAWLLVVAGVGALVYSGGRRRYAPRLAPEHARYQLLFDVAYQAAAEHGVRADWMIAIALAEGWPSWTVVNPWGFKGMWQFSDATARFYGWQGTPEEFLASPLEQARTMARALADYVRRARERCGVEPTLALAATMHHDGMGVCRVSRPETPTYLSWVDERAERVGAMLATAAG